MVQLQSLCMHIQRGCLSDIESGGGTGYNEALHRHVNPHFSHSDRMGLSLAYSLLTLLLYKHNMKKELESSLARLIGLKLGAATSSTSTQFGIVGKSDEHGGDELPTDEGPSPISIQDIESQSLMLR